MALVEDDQGCALAPLEPVHQLPQAGLAVDAFSDVLDLPWLGCAGHGEAHIRTCRWVMGCSLSSWRPRVQIASEQLLRLTGTCQS